MANALDAVLQLRAQEQAKQEAQGQQISQAFQLFQQARQQAQANQLAQLQMKASLAKDGLKLDSTGNFVRDESLKSETDKIIEKGKLAASEKAIYEAGGPMPSAFSKGGVGGAIGQIVDPSVNVVGTNQGTSNIIAKDYDEFGRPKGFIDLEAKRQEKMSEGIPADKTGLYNLSKESIDNIDKMKDSLFPNKEAKDLDERAKSFDRGAALQSNFPNLKIGSLQIGPSFLPSEKGQDIFRWAAGVISAKQLLQTGVAARPDETKKLVEAYIPSGVSNAKSSLKGLNELQNFYVSFNHDLKTLGIDDLQKKYPGVKLYLESIKNNQGEAIPNDVAESGNVNKSNKIPVFDADKETRYQAWKAKNK